MMLAGSPIMNKACFGIVVLAALAISPEVAFGQKEKQIPQKETQIPQEFGGCGAILEMKASTSVSTSGE